jgi:hypothetical protein
VNAAPMEHALPQVHLGLLPYSLERLCWRELHTPFIAYEFASLALSPRPFSKRYLCAPSRQLGVDFVA